MEQTNQAAELQPAPLGSTIPGSAGKGAAKSRAAARKPSKAKVTKTAKKAKGKQAVKSEATGPAVLRDYAQNYVKTPKEKGTTAGGHQMIDNGDKTAVALRGMDLDKLYVYAAKVLKEDKDGNRLTADSLKKQYKHLNAGMVRMNLGNRLRAAG